MLICGRIGVAPTSVLNQSNRPAGPQIRRKFYNNGAVRTLWVFLQYSEVPTQFDSKANSGKTGLKTLNEFQTESRIA